MNFPVAFAEPGNPCQESGEPFVVLHGKGVELFAARGAQRLLVSLTHTEHYAAATAVLES